MQGSLIGLPRRLRSLVPLWIALAPGLAGAAQLPEQPPSGQQPPTTASTPQEPATPELPPLVPRRRPHGAVFGPRAADAAARQVLDLSVALFGAYDDNALSGQGGGAARDPRLQVNGTFGGATGNLSFTRRWRRMTLAATGMTAFRYYPDLTELSSASHNGTVGVVVNLTPRTVLSVGGGIGYSPYYSFAPLEGVNPGVPIGEMLGARPDLALFSSPVVTTSATADLTHSFSQRSSFTLLGARHRGDFAEGRSDLRDDRVGGRYERQLTRRLGLRLGYSYRRARPGGFVGAAVLLESHDADVGFDYTRPLGRARRTMIGASTGAAIVQRADTETTYYRFLGSGFVSHQFGRSWEARADYRRALQILEGLPEPYYADAFAASLSGYLGRRVDVRATAGYTDGELGIRRTARRLSAFNATGRVNLAVSQFVMVYSEYLFYHYRFVGAVALPEGFPPAFDRHGVRVGVMSWIPLARAR
ncbi:MAG: hypothetical protein KBA95_03840 [Acidobacteria bacterium]|nr:hypothetical protein [Acidobacteriota bacterium]